jgi:hypothetical protein
VLPVRGAWGMLGGGVMAFRGRWRVKGRLGELGWG